MPRSGRPFDPARRRVLQAGAALSGLAAAGRPLGALAANRAAADAPASERVLSRIAFGSCADQTKAQPIWDAVVAARPDLFAFLGDTVYADTTDMDAMRAAYDRLAAKPGFQALREATQVVAVWDDHDYGANDAGRGYPKKQEARRIFLDAFGEPADSPRRTRPDGLYTSTTFGPAGRRVQVILLDTRWNRSPLPKVDGETFDAERRPANRGPYLPTDAPGATLLGEAQWTWLAARLREPAELRLICTSVPFLADFTGWETWANVPREKQRMIDTIAETGASGVLFLSGDTHYAEFSQLDAGTPYPLWEAVSSSLTHTWSDRAPSRTRVGPTVNVDNFGLVRIDWEAARPSVSLEIRDGQGALRKQTLLPLDTLRA